MFAIPLDRSTEHLAVIALISTCKHPESRVFGADQPSDAARSPAMPICLHYQHLAWISNLLAAIDGTDVARSGFGAPTCPSSWMVRGRAETPVHTEGAVVAARSQQLIARSGHPRASHLRASFADGTATAAGMSYRP
jgi:hypothetical protein